VRIPTCPLDLFSGVFGRDSHMLTLDAAGRPTYAKPGKSASSVRAAGRVLKENPNQATTKAAMQLPSIKGACLCLYLYCY